ncbi:MAG: dicarboxylate/amino acid:cation symporter [Amoebophilaceae bacterium]|jgi:Na+/H+-dicarboxylate symporter|nr:dicarboxylate/amino acid:cation symporter [Amoebophilaceae bacterium]
MRKIALHIQILIGMASGLAFALLSVKLGWSTSLTTNYIKPFGTVFLNSLKMVAIPLVFVSLVVGVTSIEDVTKLSRIGGKTFFIYTATTILAVVLGLTIANLIEPGKVIAGQTRDRLMTLYASEAEQRGETVQAIQNQNAPLQIFVDLIPENLVASMSKNEHLLQVVLVAIMLGIALLRIPPRKSRPVVLFFEGINDAIIELIRFIMNLAPIGVFSLVASLLVEVVGDSKPSEIFEILYALLWYVVTVVLGLVCMTFVVYPIMLRLFTRMSYVQFFKGIYPAQLVAFTTSSSSATLPATMERVEKHLGISEEISGFVLPLGATVNMDGTALYQGIAIVFIAQALGIELSTTAQLIIVANVVISSVGVAGVPGGAMVTTMILLQALGIPAAGLALILAPDRILDMCRTVTNVTGDAVAAVIIASSEK